MAMPKVLVVVFALLVSAPAAATDIDVYKDPNCGCCQRWVEHLQANGFSVKVHDVADFMQYKQGVPSELAACHTAKVGGYLIEGHVPASDIRRLLKERPKVSGIAVPGMPAGSPGMEGPRAQRYEVLTFDKDGNTAVFAQH